MKIDRIIKTAENRGFKVARLSNETIRAYKLRRAYYYKSYNEMYNKLIKETQVV